MIQLNHSIFSSIRPSSLRARVRDLSLLIALACFSLAGNAASYSVTSGEDQNIIQDRIGSPDSELLLGDLQEIRERRLLRVLVTHSQTDFFIREGQIRGVQADLVYELLKHLNRGIKRESDKLFVQFIPVEFHQLLPALVSGEGDIAAAFLTITPDRQALVEFITSQKMKVDEVLVRNHRAPPVEHITELSGKQLYVLKDSSYSEHLKALNQQLKVIGKEPILITQADDRLLTEDILELVNAGIVEYTICDDFKAELWWQVLPNLRVENDVKISTEKSAGWAIRKDSPDLKVALDEFNKKVKKGSMLGNILFKRYFGNTRWIENPLEKAERDKFYSTIGLFTKYGKIYGFDPLALAAQAYQESKLNNQITSHRGAIGIMQIMPATAKDRNVAISNIRELENNIHAGAKYLRFLRSHYFTNPDISPLDQTLFSWAAYNAGPANIIRIRNAAKRNGLDENVWFGNVEVMAARMISREPVRYVANIHKYYTAYRLVEERSLQRQQALKLQNKKT